MTTKPFYTIDPKMYLDYSSKVSLGTISCSADDGHMRNAGRSSPLIVKIKNKSFPEIMDSWAGDILIREDKIASLEGLTGFEFRDAYLEHPKGWKDVPNYFELVITGFGGALSHISGLKIKKKCPVCGLVMYSIPQQFRDQIPQRFIDSDAFRTWPILTFIHVSSEFTDKFSKPVKAASFIPLEEADYSEGSYTGKRLIDFYPKERSEEIAEKFKSEMEALANS